MPCFNPDCVGQCNFERIAYYARRRFIDGIDTVSLMEQADDELARREIALAALLDLDDATFESLELFDCNSLGCRARALRRQLKSWLERLAQTHETAAGF